MALYYYYYLVLSYGRKFGKVEKKSKDHSINLSKLPIYISLLMEGPTVTFLLTPPPTPSTAQEFLILGC